MSFEKILRTDYVTKPNNPNQLPSNQVKVKVTILTTHFHYHQYDTKETNIKDLELFIENIEKYIFDTAAVKNV